MTNSMKNMVMSFAIFWVLVILINTAWVGVKSGYNVQETGTDAEGLNVFEKLGTLSLISGIEELGKGISKFTKIANPTDILGGLALVAGGSLQVIGGIVLFPVQIMQVITGFYGNTIPPVVTQLVGFIAIIGVGFILLSAKLGFQL
jgi:hypothetical protein